MMRGFTLLSALVALASGVSAHYRFTSLIVGTTTTSPYQYVRSNTNSNSPITDVTSNDLRCNAGGLASGPSTQTATVSAGTTVGFALDQAIFHQGTLNVYMAKAPDNVAASDFDGSGTVWFKVHVYLTQFSFQLPDALPSGQYLLRVEHIALHGASSFGGAQIYISCAQLNVINGGNGAPGPLVAIPGVYDGHEPGIQINIYWPVPVSYTQPGPAVWLG
ncbi:hypothetical protein PC9H_002891 [Pleurotus ostreatus]|uniref:lytic cellulose monooxygenase (C4-dehydrogenating) n=1 Tax=Pleurotus ostreatus TaxID=5322 RepID=A0A8H7A4S6_PLEOS|nr:uncharacterized protein PC9H_002891 [Pleurotus ostreatus]KAF7436065.1 hypothetical protein PC9H_002891 [Pleurotus ostreatus]